MNDSLLTEVAETGMTVDNLNPLPYHDVAEYGEEGEDCRESRLSVDDEKGDMVDLDPVCQVSHALAALVRMCDDDDFVPTINELLNRC